MCDLKQHVSVVACRTAHGKYAQKLLTDLFANYTSALRPVEDTHNILTVTLQVTLSQIIDMVKQYKACAFTHTMVFLNITNKENKKLAINFLNCYFKPCLFPCTGLNTCMIKVQFISQHTSKKIFANEGVCIPASYCL